MPHPQCVNKQMLMISSHVTSCAGTQPLWLIHTLYYGSLLNVADLAEILCILMTIFCLLNISSVTCIQSHLKAGVCYLSNNELCHESSPSSYFTLWWATDFTKTHYFRPTHLHFNIIRVKHFLNKQQHHQRCYWPPTSNSYEIMWWTFLMG